MPGGNLGTTRAGAAGVVSPVPREAWSAVWEASEEATVFHTAEWLDACCQAGGFEDVSRLYETSDGERIVVPLVRRARWPAPTCWSMPPGWAFGGAFGTRHLTAEDVAMIVDDLRRGWRRLVVSPGPVNGDAWAAVDAPVRVRHDAHVVDLVEGFDALWWGFFSSDTRNKVRKAEKRGVEVEWAPGVERIGVYWDLYLRWSARRAQERGTPVRVGLALARRQEPLARFEAVARALGERCQVMVARVDGRPTAAVIAVLGRLHSHYWRATSDKDLVRRHFANDLLMARLLERAAAHGSRYVHMGESGGVRSLIQFKERFGAQPVCYGELRFESMLVTRTMRARDQVLGAAGDLASQAAGRLRRPA